MWIKLCRIILTNICLIKDSDVIDVNEYGSVSDTNMGQAVASHLIIHLINDTDVIDEYGLIRLC